MMADDPLMAGDVFTHAEAYYASDRTSLVALCDIDRGKLEDAGNRWTVSDLFTDAATMMSEASPAPPNSRNVSRAGLHGTFCL